ncbi:MAG TPA: triose-phosphate isomerase [Cellulomonas sp.]|uniref:triose-phosphate isomerase n=1 Tax=Cellulomonas sp. TaxID=40001 RepID=UPI002E352BDF|nr:triose-phosphate isomerase [Cellulomonas sp.]HEX5332150.1 triose-phosphate isomerase [Cellulomonas sp.]
MTTWVGTSWKMNKTLAQARDYAETLAATDPGRWPGVQPFILPPATALASVSAVLGRGSHVLVGAQNAHWADDGAWTGEVSVPQVADAGATIVEIGHSERRAYFAETDATVNLKVQASLRHGLTPLVCVGEPDEVFASGSSVLHVLDQVRAALDGVDDVSSVVLAYEPIWAIGFSGRPAAAADIADVFAALSAEWGSAVRGILFGGSVNPGNALATLGVDGVDGLFIGRAAWDVTGFIGLLDLVAAR